MTEKTFTLAEEGTNKKFKLLMSCNSSSIDFNLESVEDPKEKYQPSKKKIKFTNNSIVQKKLLI